MRVDRRGMKRKENGYNGEIKMTERRRIRKRRKKGKCDWYGERGNNERRKKGEGEMSMWRREVRRRRRKGESDEYGEKEERTKMSIARRKNGEREEHGEKRKDGEQREMRMKKRSGKGGENESKKNSQEKSTGEERHKCRKRGEEPACPLNDDTAQFRLTHVAELITYPTSGKPQACGRKSLGFSTGHQCGEKCSVYTLFNVQMYLDILSY